MTKFIRIDSQLAKDAENVLNDIGIDLEAVVKMTLKRVIREGNISFLTASHPAPIEKANVVSSVTPGDGRIAKNQAISLFEASGIHLSRNTTFASKNRGANNYWANPYFFALDSDWYLILNDWIKRELHLFLIPARTIPHKNMISRIDQADKIDLQISYNDPTFTDTRSKISFARYLVKSIKY